MKTFRQVWAQKEAEGYQYGEDALEQVRFGWDLAMAEAGTRISTLTNQVVKAIDLRTRADARAHRRNVHALEGALSEQAMLISTMRLVLMMHFKSCTSLHSALRKALIEQDAGGASWAAVEREFGCKL